MYVCLCTSTCIYICTVALSAAAARCVFCGVFAITNFTHMYVCMYVCMYMVAALAVAAARYNIYIYIYIYIYI